MVPLQEFLNRLNIRINEAEIKRWHPQFKLDDVPDIVPAELPQAPVVKKFSSAKDILDDVKEILNPRVCLISELVKFDLTI